VNARRREVWLWTAQRATAAILAVCVVVHLVTIVYAVRGGLSAAEILGRTRGHVAWGIFYSVFVFAAAIHGSIGLRTIAAEWLGFRGRTAEVATLAIALALAITGMRAVLAVVSA
jgi:fumarate reductase subunit C